MIMDPRSMPRFRVGQLVRHVRYGYRGVIVAFDPDCRADDAWYRRNRTQPDRDQPWYHVLVHQAGHTTYAAQTSLEKDPEGGPIDHPLLDRFFDRFEDGGYVRNDEPWTL